MKPEHLMIVNPEHLMIVDPEQLDPQLSEEFKNACSYYVRKLTAISNRCWSDYIPNIEEKHGYLEAAEVRQLMNLTALSGNFSDFAYTYFTLLDIMKK